MSITLRTIAAIVLFVIAARGVGDEWAHLYLRGEPAAKLIGPLIATAGLMILPFGDSRLLAIPWLLDPFCLLLFGRIAIWLVMRPAFEPIPRATWVRCL